MGAGTRRCCDRSDAGDAWCRLVRPGAGRFDCGRERDRRRWCANDLDGGAARVEGP